MRLDAKIIADLGIAFTPRAYVRVTRMAHAATPLGMGFGKTRFASPTDAFKVLYLAKDLTTSVAETIVRDRFQAKARRSLDRAEVAQWGVTTVEASRPLTLIDLRTVGLVRLGVSTNAARGKAQDQGRKLSQALYEQTDVDGLLYASRLTGADCVCVYERSASVLQAAPVANLATAPGLITALQALNVALDPDA